MSTSRRPNERSRERPLTAAPHPLGRHRPDADPDDPTRHDLDGLPLDVAVRRLSRG